MYKLSHAWERKIDLIYLLTLKEVALKYKRTFLGIFWSLLNPLLMTLVYFIAFKVFMRFKVDNYTFFLLSALFPWTWFSSSLIISARSLVDNVSLIKKVVFPRSYLVAAVINAQLVNLIFSIPILLFLAFFYTGGPAWCWVIGIPLLIAIQFLFTLGITLIVSISNTYFRDIEYLVGVFMNLIFWMTPIIYPMSSVPEKYRPLFFLNPLTSLMSAWRELFLHNTLQWKESGIALGMALLTWGIGVAVFRKLERRLDEVL